MNRYNTATLHTIIDEILSDMNMFVNIDEDEKYDTYDIIHTNIDNYVANNTIKQNKSVLAFYKTDIYDAMNMYKEEYGDFEARDKEHFYALLAFHLIRTYIMEVHYERMEEKYNEFKKARDDELSDEETEEEN